ncbi:hypothetical protein [Acetobacter sp. LMG 32666]
MFSHLGAQGRKPTGRTRHMGGQAGQAGHAMPMLVGVFAGCAP